MTITEIGLLKLKPTASLDDADLRAKLTHIKTSLQAFTGYPFYYLQQVDDPSYIHLMGEWESLEQHYKDVHSSTEWKQMLPIMMQYFEFQWMAHYDCTLGELHLGDGKVPVVGLGRYVIKEGKRSEVERRFEDSKGSSSRAVPERKVVSGWKVDEGRKREEFVLLAPFDDVPQKSMFEEHFEVGELGEETDIKHMRIVKGI